MTGFVLCHDCGLAWADSYTKLCFNCFSKFKPDTQTHENLTMENLKEYLYALEAMAKIEHLTVARARKLLDVDATPTMLRLLLAVSEWPDDSAPTATEVAKLLKVTPQAAGQQAYELLTEGLIEHQRDEGDKRLRRLTVTPAGTEVLALMSAACETYAQEDV